MVTTPGQVIACLAALIIRPTLRDRIIEAQNKDSFLQKIKNEVGIDKKKDFGVAEDQALIFRGRICVPKDEALRNEILKEAHSTPSPHIPMVRKCIEIFEIHFSGEI